MINNYNGEQAAVVADLSKSLIIAFFVQKTWKRIFLPAIGACITQMLIEI